jgi:hypothetical protein
MLRRNPQQENTMKNAVISLIFLGLSVGALAAEAVTPRAYIVSPKDGETLNSPVTVVFGLEGFGVAPAGTAQEKTGHHHLIIDAPLPDMTQPIPANDNYQHFGGGQTQVEVTLPPGKHTLQLLLGDHAHMPHNPPVFSEVVTINVR